MTSGVFPSFNPVGASLAGVRRTLDLARLALHASEAELLPPDHIEPDNGVHFCTSVIPGETSVATLIVRGDPARQWTAEDRTMLVGLAAQLAAEIRFSRERTLFDHHPGLVFERRASWPAKDRCRILGTLHQSVPGLRALIEGGIDEDALAAVHSGDRDTVRDALMSASLDGRDLDLLFRMEDRDGVSRWLHCRSGVRRDQESPAIWYGACSDVTGVVARTEGPAASLTSDAAVASEASELEGADPEGADPEGAGRLILLADDLDLNRKLISDMLSYEGYVVDSVADGAAAVEAAKAKSYDLILMDMIMPGMDGMDATRAIRAFPAPGCDVPIVALTAHSFREQLDNCLNAGMNATLTKPMSFDALSAAVNTWTRSRRQAA